MDAEPTMHTTHLRSLHLSVLVCNSAKEKEKIRWPGNVESGMQSKRVVEKVWGLNETGKTYVGDTTIRHYKRFSSILIRCSSACEEFLPSLRR